MPPNTPEEFFEGEYQNRHLAGIPTPFFQENRDRIVYNRSPSQDLPEHDEEEHLRPGSGTTSRTGASGMERGQLADDEADQMQPRSRDRPRSSDGFYWTSELSSAAQSPAIPSLGSSALRPSSGRSQMPKFDWHALEYVSQYDDNLDCPICRSPLVQPMRIRCDHVFCRQCLARTVAHGDTCPVDRQPLQYDRRARRIETIDVPRIIKNQLDNLQVKCPNAHCGYVCARSAIEHHYADECSFTKIPCPDSTCDKLVARGQSIEDGCLHVETPCSRCGKQVELASLNDHNDEDCDHGQLTCKHCDTDISRQCWNEHVAACPEWKIDCRFKAAGCPFSNKRDGFGDHERHCVYGLVVRMSQANRAEVDGLKTELRETKEQVRRLEAALASAQPGQPSSPSVEPAATSSHNNAGTRVRPQQASIRTDAGSRVVDHMELITNHFENVTNWVQDLERRMGYIMVMQNDLMPMRNEFPRLVLQVRRLAEAARRGWKRSDGPTAVLGAGSNGDGDGDLARPMNGDTHRAGSRVDMPIRLPPSHRTSERENPPRL